MRWPEGKPKENETVGRKRERVGCAGPMSSDTLCFSFVSTRVCGREGGE